MSRTEALDLKHRLFFYVLKKEEDVCGVRSRQADKFKQI
jgi:hypothetical protein